MLTAPDQTVGAGRTVMNHLYSALVDPLAELCGRMGWGVLAAIGFILTYAICYNIWASFAYPFYLDYMHYTKDEVAFASKIFGIIMTMLGHQPGRLPVRQDRALPDDPARRHPAAARQFPLCRSCRRRADDRRVSRTCCGSTRWRMRSAATSG